MMQCVVVGMETMKTTVWAMTMDAAMPPFPPTDKKTTTRMRAADNVTSREGWTMTTSNKSGWWMM